MADNRKLIDVGHSFNLQAPFISFVHTIFQLYLLHVPSYLLSYEVHKLTTTTVNADTGNAYNIGSIT